MRGCPGREYDPSLKDSWAELWRFLKESCRFTSLTPTIESAAKEAASAEKAPIGGRGVARAAIAREPEGAWTTGGSLEDGSLQRKTGQVNASYTSFYI